MEIVLVGFSHFSTKFESYRYNTLDFFDFCCIILTSVALYHILIALSFVFFHQHIGILFSFFIGNVMKAFSLSLDKPKDRWFNGTNTIKRSDLPCL